MRHVYQVKPLSGGDVHAQPAVVTYRPDSPTGTDVQVCCIVTQMHVTVGMHARPLTQVCCKCRHCALRQSA